MTLGPLELSFRSALPEDPLSWGVCASETCAVWQTFGDPKNPFTADLVIDGHWWHLERFNALADTTDGNWLMSPAGPAPDVFKQDGTLHTSWRATDLGTRTQAARTTRQPDVFTRPVR